MYSCSHVVITVRDHTDCKYCLYMYVCMYIHPSHKHARHDDGVKYPRNEESIYIYIYNTAHK